MMEEKTPFAFPCYRLIWRVITKRRRKKKCLHYLLSASSSSSSFSLFVYLLLLLLLLLLCTWNINTTNKCHAANKTDTLLMGDSEVRSGHYFDRTLCAGYNENSPLACFPGVGIGDIGDRLGSVLEVGVGRGELRLLVTLVQEWSTYARWGDRSSLGGSIRRSWAGLEILVVSWPKGLREQDDGLRKFFFFLYHKPLAPAGFMGAEWTCLLLVIWRRFRFFIVTPRMFTFSLEYVENERGYCCYSLRCI